MVVLLLQSSLLYSQNIGEIKKDTTIFDVSKFPVFKLDSMKNGAKVTYFTFDKVDASTKVQFVGGYESLSQFCDSLYFEKIDVNLIGLNAKALYTILLDKELKIKDVRIIKRIGYDNKNFNFDDIVIDVLKDTEFNWMKLNNDSDYFFYTGLFNLR